jgi:hypothetical protein
MKTLLALGCSNTSDSWGKSWPDLLSEKLNYNLIRASSNGAGSSFFIEKLNFILQNDQVDYVVVQLSEPSRIVLGMKSFENNNKSYTDGCSFNGIGCYTWNAWENDNNILKITKEKHQLDKFWLREVSISKWVNYKICQDICVMQYICDSFNKPVVFFSWFVNFDKLFVPEYMWLKTKINYISGHAVNFFETNNISPDPKRDYHYNSEANKLMVEDWILPNIKGYFI